MRRDDRRRRHADAIGQAWQHGPVAREEKCRSPKAPAVQGGNAQEDVPRTGPMIAPPARKGCRAARAHHVADRSEGHSAAQRRLAMTAGSSEIWIDRVLITAATRRWP